MICFCSVYGEGDVIYMIKNFKKFLSGLLVAVMLFALPAIPIKAASERTERAKWMQNSGNITAVLPTLTSDNYLRVGGESAPSETEFNVLDNLKFENNGKNYELEITYVDGEGGFFYFEYTDIDENTATSDIVYTKNNGSNEATASLNLKRAYINRGKNSDFKICTTYKEASGNEIKSEEVQIKSITLYEKDTYADADVKMTTDKAGNIFYTGEKIEFEAEIENCMNEQQDINVQTDIYILDKNDTKTRIGGDEETVTVGANATALKVYDYTSIADKYGRYLFSISLSGGKRGIEIAKEYEFSKSVYNDVQNDKYGINTHTSRGRGDADVIFSLAKNAGVGRTRETINWESYEPTQKNYGLTETQEYALDTMAKYDIDPLITIYGNNRAYEKGDYVTSGNTENYKNFIKKLLDEPKMKNVKRVEIYNEPDLPQKKYFGDTQISDTNATTSVRGQYYGDMLTAGYDAVKSLSRDVEVYGLAFCRLANVNYTKKFLDGVAEKVNSYSASHNGNLPFDKVSLHSYVTASVESDSGTDVISGKNYWEIVDFYKSYFNSKINAQSSFEVTEYGFSNPNESNRPLYANNEHMQAALNLRAYLIMQSNNFENAVYAYDFMNDGVIENEKEHNFGMVRNESYRVPYAAKANYLAVSALNLFTFGANSAKLYEQSDGYVAEYAKTNGKTYVLWNTKDGEINYSLPDNAVFYDMYGNKLDKSDICINGKYKVSETPYYAVTDGAAPMDSERESGYVKISGEIESAKEEVDVSLTIVPATVKTADVAKAVYVNQMKTYQNGVFEFRVAGLEDSKEYTAYIKAGDFSETVIRNFTNDGYIEHIKLYSDDVVAKRLSTIDMKNSYIEIDKATAGDNYKAVCACYKDGVLVYLAMSNSQNTTEENGMVKVDVSTNNTIDYNMVKVFLWNSDFSKMEPLYEAKVFDK